MEKNIWEKIFLIEYNLILIEWEAYFDIIKKVNSTLFKSLQKKERNNKKGIE